MSRTIWAWARIVVPSVTRSVLVWRLGTGPFLDGLRTIDARALVAAAGIAALTTLCCAWRWKTVAGGLGAELSLPAAVAAYYRSQFLNVTLPGGIVGDVHRGISHGRDVDDVGRAVRSVAWERLAGQVVQGLVTVVVLLALRSPVRPYMPLVATQHRWLGAARGRDAWAFGAAGLGVQQGVSTAVVYGVMVFVASLPGAIVLVVAWFRRTRPSRQIEPPLRERTAHA